MDTFIYKPTYAYTDGSGLCNTYETGKEYTFDDLKERLREDAFKDDDIELATIEIKFDNIRIYGEARPCWYFDFFVDTDNRTYRIGRCNDDLLDFIHYFSEYANIKNLI